MNTIRNIAGIVLITVLVVALAIFVGKFIAFGGGGR
jgi:hypothetical protein